MKVRIESNRIHCLQALCLLFSFSVLTLFPSAALSSSGQAKNPNKRVVLSGQINILLGSCADAGVIISSTSLPAPIEKVRLGSPAYYAGLVEGDKILDGVIKEEHVQLLIERKGKKYGIKLGTVNKGLIRQVPRPDFEKPGLDNKTPYLTGNLNKLSQEEILLKLKEWKIVLMIDKSGSMSLNIPDNSKSKWQWCRENIAGFSTAFNKLCPSRLDLVLFDTTHSVKKNCSPGEIENIFKNYHPDGSTNFSTPLKMALEEYALEESILKPLLVVVITDGLFNAGAPIESLIIDGVNKLPERKPLAITFLEISGNDSLDTRNYLQILDEDLVSQGVKRDVVDTMYFNEIQSLGFIKSLGRAINYQRPPRIYKNPPAVIRNKIDQIRERLKEEKNDK